MKKVSVHFLNILLAIVTLYLGLSLLTDGKILSMSDLFAQVSKNGRSDADAKPLEAQESSGSFKKPNHNVANVFNDISKPLHFNPVRMDINRLKLLGVVVEEVGVTETGKMEVPDGWDTVGWYRYGPKVGEKGNIVIAGHYDTTFGTPAVFYNLGQLSVDDTIVLYDKVGKRVEYVVFESEYVGNSDSEAVKRAFRETEEPELTLITCGGVWDPSVQSYSHRLLIKARLVGLHLEAE